MKKGTQLFGDEGVDAVVKELQQLHDRQVLEPKDAATMSQDEKRAVLQYLMFLKQKGMEPSRVLEGVLMGESNGMTPKRRMQACQK